ncbi:hypothetical protein [Arthrobacter cupressi]|uniref:Uncharacterized protein n=1 Tax=Arthrobacter cupressi TaxID=1045773 RepID=A0A1G8HYE9_9MICC|nr:hypothetical protein [Arthrobacter cupressi]NYD78845.1 hypothetical protein [Arthrobacter cupressi]SDI11699.1 hypothetical protein SAMN05216555_10171 [Arthrobacter cupressi]
MSITGYRRPLTIAAAVVALLSLAAVGGVMAIAAAGSAAPAWMTSLALYGLPAAFLAMLVLVVDAVVQRRRK